MLNKSDIKTLIANCLYYYYDTLKDKILTKDNTTEYTPTDNYNPATKKYVDDFLSNKTDSNHTHDNKEVLDTITTEKIEQWNNNTTSSISITTISQSDYDALETKDASTLYLITTVNAGEIDTNSNDITLSDELPAGTYTLKYEDENNQPLEGFDEITTMEVQ